MVNFSFIFKNNITAKPISNIGKSVAVTKINSSGKGNIFNVLINGMGFSILAVPVKKRITKIE